MTDSPNGNDSQSADAEARTYSEDGWQNILNMQGTRRDPTTATRGKQRMSIPQSEREALYATGGIARKIIDIPAGDMTRQWFDLDTKGGAALMQEMDAIGIQHHVTWAIKMARLHGGSLLLLLIDDGGDLPDKVKEDSIREIQGARVYDREELSRQDFKYDDDPASPTYGEVSVYRVHPQDGGQPFDVHSSRVVLFPGLRVPNRLKQINDGWDYSFLDNVYRALQRDENTAEAGAAILQDFVQAALSIKGLTDLVAAGKDDVVRKRLELLDMSRHVLNTMILDADEEQYEKHSSSVAGVSDVMDRQAERVSAIAEIPMTRLYTRSPAGMNATGESDMRNYYDSLKSEQTSMLQPRMERIVRLFMLARNGAFSGREPESWSIKWRPLWQPTEKEQAETRKSIAEADRIYLETGVVEPAEVAITRFGDGEYNDGPIRIVERQTQQGGEGDA